MVFSLAVVDLRVGWEGAAAVSSSWNTRPTGDLRGGPAGEAHEARHVPYLPPQFRHAPLAGQLRHMDNPDAVGHSDVRTTMIYTHCVPSMTVKEAKSPLDF